MIDARDRSSSTELMNLSPFDLKTAYDLLAHDLLGDAPIGQSPSHQLREAILSQVLFESISRQKREEGKYEAQK